MRDFTAERIAELKSAAMRMSAALNSEDDEMHCFLEERQRLRDAEESLLRHIRALEIDADNYRKMSWLEKAWYGLARWRVGKW